MKNDSGEEEPETLPEQIYTGDSGFDIVDENGCGVSYETILEIVRRYNEHDGLVWKRDWLLGLLKRMRREIHKSSDHKLRSRWTEIDDDITRIAGQDK